MTTIHNEQLQVTITDVGMEICSVVRLDNNREYIWEAHPSVWGSHAPVLFPIIGGLKDGQYSFAGHHFPLPKHGFIRNNPNLRIVDYQPEQITFELASSPALQLVYPFDFTFQLTYRLDGDCLNQEHRVINHADEPMYFSVGGHPAFRVPHFAGERYEDYYLAFEFPEVAASHTVNDAGLIGPDTREVPWQDNQLPLTHELFNQDALVFKSLRSRYVDLVSLQYGKILTVNYENFDYLGIWAKPNGNFVCIEPWLGIADNHNTDGEFSTKEGIIELAGGGDFRASFVMKFH